MSMSASSMKSIPLSANDRSRLVTKHATHAQAVEKVFDDSNKNQVVAFSRLTYQTYTNW